MIRISIAIVAGWLGMHTGCASDTGEPDGEAPTVSQVTLSPTDVPVGQQTTLAGTLAFSDGDGDLAQLGVRLTPPGGPSMDAPLVDIVGRAGATSGVVAFSLSVLPPQAGRYPIEVWVIDEAGHESNREMTAIDAH